MTSNSLETDYVTLVLYFVYLWFGLLTLFIFSSCIIKSFYSFVIFISQYWLRCSITTEGLGLISVDRVEIFLWDTKTYIMIEEIGLSFLDPFTSSLLRITVGKTRVEYIHSVPPSSQEMIRWYHKLIPRFFTKNKQNKKPRQRGFIYKVFIKIIRYLLSFVQIEFCIFEFLTSHELQTDLFALLTAASTVISIYPFSNDKYSLDLTLQVREIKASFEMRNDPTTSDLPSLLSLRTPILAKLCYNALFPTQPVTHLELSVNNSHVSFLQKAPEIFTGFIKLFFVKRPLTNNNSDNQSIEAILSNLFSNNNPWYFPSSLSLLCTNCSVSYLTFSGQSLRCIIKQCLLELKSEEDCIRNISSSIQYRGDRRGTGAGVLCKVTGAKLETTSMEHVMSLGDLLCDIEINRHILNKKTANTSDSIKNIAKNKFKKMTNILWRFMRDKKSKPDSNNSKLYNLSITIDFKSLYLKIDPVILANFISYEISTLKIDSQSNNRFTNLFTSDKTFASRQISISSEDVVIDLYHTEPLIRSKEPLFKLVYANSVFSVILSSECLPIIIFTSQDLYIHTPGVSFNPDKTNEPTQLCSKPDNLSILPGTGSHLWGRFFECAKLNFKSEIPFVRNSQNPISISVIGSLINLEFSRDTLFAIEWLLSPFLPVITTDNTNTDNTLSVTCPEFSINCSMQNLNIFIYDDNPNAPSLLFHSGFTCCESSTDSVLLSASEIGVLPIQVDEERFAVSTLANLPQGLLENDLLTAAISWKDTPYTLELGSEVASLYWSPTKHCHFAENIRALSLQLREAKRFLSNRLSFLKESSTSIISFDNQPKLEKEGFEYRSFVGQIRSIFDISCGCKQFDLTIRPDFNTRVVLNFKENYGCLKSGQLSFSSRNLKISFDKQEIISFDQIFLIRMNHPTQELSQYRVLFPETVWPSNYPIAISFQRLVVSFPYKYNFALVVHKLTNILKFLKRTHWPISTDNTRLIVPPDIILSAEEILIDLPDDAFEVKLRDQYELKSDESMQKSHRWLLLNEKIRGIKSQEGELGTSDKIASLQESLNTEDSMVYINRVKSFYQKNPMRHWLLRIKLSKCSLTILADPSLQGTNNLFCWLAKLNPESPITEDLEFSILWGRYTKGIVAKFELTLRDYSQPLLAIDRLDFQGTVLGAERKGGPFSIREGSVDIFPPWESYKLNLNVCPLKFIHDLTAETAKIDFAWGAAFEYAWNQVGEATEMLYLPTIDPSPPLPFWDRIRIKRHGNFRLKSDTFTVYALSSKDPYNNTESLVVEMQDFEFLWSKCNLKFDGEVSFFVSTASKYDNCRIAYLPKACLEIEMKWITSGNLMDHHSIVPISKYRASPPFSDSYSAFRSSNLDLSISFNIQSINRSGHDLKPKFVCYASTIRWLENFKNNVILNVTRPTRKGTVWYNVRIPKKKLSRHFRIVAFDMNLNHFQLSYWSSYNNRIGLVFRVNALSLKSEYKLAINPVLDGLIHRPRAKFHVQHCSVDTSNFRIDTRCFSPNMEMKEIKFVYISAFSYTYNTTSFNRDSVDGITPSESNPYRHHIEATTVKFLWNCFNRKIVFSLYESYENSRILRKNMSTEVLMSIALLKKALKQSSLAEHTPVRQDNHFPSPSSVQKSSKRILELDRFLELREKSRSHEDIMRCSQPEVLFHENRWLINMREIQLALCCEREEQQAGEYGEGWLLITSAHSFVTGLLDEPRWNKGSLLQKKIWEARINLIQYFASHSFSKAGQVPWLDSALILGESSSNDTIYSELFPQEDDLAREQQDFALGAVYSSEASDLLRIAYSTYCSVSYSTYHELESENSSDLEIYSSKESLTSSNSFNTDTASSFYLRHPELKVATSSVQYSIVLDIVNNLLLHFETEKKKVTHRYEQLKFEIELNNSCKDLGIVLTEFQDRVRTLASKVRTLEKNLYTADHGHKGPRPLSGEGAGMISGVSTRSLDLQSQFSQAKDDLASASLDLKLIIKYIKEVEFTKSSSEGNVEMESGSSTTREVDIWLEEARWTLLQDGQLAIAEIDLGEAFYCVSTNQDGSGEHRFELGCLSVRNLLPNTPFPNALSAYDPGLSNPKIDCNSSLRIFLKERAPVGGIYLKEHLEVNLVPLAIRLTRRFYKTLFAYFFQQTSSSMHSDLTDGFVAGADGTSLDLVSLSGDSVNGEDIERMKERAGKNKSFIYIKIPVVPICLSYKGNKEKNIEDVRDLECVFGPLEYHNQIYTWKELFIRLKKEIKRLVISQAFKRKIGIRTSFEVRPGSNIQEAEKAKLIGVRKSPTVTRKRKKKGMKLAIADSDFSTSVPTDESDQSDFTCNVSEPLPFPYNHQHDY
ncbi:hypothetical protein LOD99_5914 [Oopsacas minuta]|uniref:FMP27/BLTP2/Hobbit GFWDK motif-containing RBG unit domain-containing protein n=1 Tax=Oopsacas minuta TaxID=111878 RepID=A0AAV7JNC5_9METZ|nr:hypothetical protein LOD99_5914 [Oopsacas minuta]